MTRSAELDYDTPNTQTLLIIPNRKINKPFYCSLQGNSTFTSCISLLHNPPTPPSIFSNASKISFFNPSLGPSFRSLYTSTPSAVNRVFWNQVTTHRSPVSGTSPYPRISQWEVTKNRKLEPRQSQLVRELGTEAVSTPRTFLREDPSRGSYSTRSEILRGEPGVGWGMGE